MSRSVLEGRRARSLPVTTQIIQGAWRGRFPGNSRFAFNCRKLAGAYGGKGPRPHHRFAVDLFEVVERRTSILEDVSGGTRPVVALLLRVAGHHTRWVRSLEDWHPKSTTGIEQLSELIRHLLERYPTPRFFENAWNTRLPGAYRFDWQAFEWYVHVAGGGSIHTAPALPVALSRRAAHALSRAPADLFPRAALRWAQIAGFGVRADVARALMHYQLDIEQEPFWRLFLEKLAAARDMSLDRVGPLIDYLQHRRREAKDYTLNGQSVESMLRAVERWHAELRRNQPRPGYAVLPERARWEPLPEVEPLTETSDGETWEVREISTFTELLDEGRRMHHCVASYAHACHARSISIWSLRVHDAQGELARVTIRVDVRARKVVEARRFANAFITPEQLRFIRRWADLNRFEVGKLTV